MKLIMAIIRPEKLESVQAALNERDMYLMTVSDAGGCGRYRYFTEVYRGSEFQVRVQARLKLEIAVQDEKLEAVVIPPAGYSRTSWTVMRVPTNDGLPPRTPSRTSINDSRSTATR